jgi:hypothetical protein
MRCQEFKEMMDSYLAGELLVETNHEVLRHLENCPACRSELAAQRGLLAQMRTAVKSAPEMQVNPAFTRKLRNDLRENALRSSVWGKLKSGFFVNSLIFAATAACLLVGILFGAIWIFRLPAPENIIIRQNQREKPAENFPPVESNTNQIIQAAWREMTHAAAGDHENCALHYRLKEEPITLEAGARKFGRFNQGLDKAVTAVLREVSAAKISGKAIGKIEFYDAHSCVFNGRRFAHIELKKGNKIISVLVTDSDSFAENDGTTINERAENFQVAGFRTTRHAVFVVSDLAEAENSKIAEMLAPAVRRHIKQTEA